MADVIYSVFGRQIIDKNLRDIVDNLTNRMNNNYEYKGNCDASKSINDYNTDDDLGIWRIASGSTVTDLPINRTANETIILLVDKARDGGNATLQTLIYTKQNIILKRVYNTESSAWLAWSREVVSSITNKTGGKFVQFNTSSNQIVESAYGSTSFLKASPTVNSEGNFKKLTTDELSVDEFQINYTSDSSSNFSTYYGCYNTNEVDANRDKYDKVIYDINHGNPYLLNNCTFDNNSVIVKEDGYISLPDYSKANPIDTTYFAIAMICYIPYDVNTQDIINLFNSKLVVQKRGVNGLRLVITEGPNGTSLATSDFITIDRNTQYYGIAIIGNTASANVTLTVSKISDLKNKTLTTSSVDTSSTKSIDIPLMTNVGKILANGCKLYASTEAFSTSAIDFEGTATDLINNLLNTISINPEQAATVNQVNKSVQDIYTSMNAPFSKTITRIGTWLDGTPVWRYTFDGFWSDFNIDAEEIALIIEDGYLSYYSTRIAEYYKSENRVFMLNGSMWSKTSITKNNGGCIIDDYMLIPKFGRMEWEWPSSWTASIINQKDGLYGYIDFVTPYDNIKWDVLNEQESVDPEPTVLGVDVDSNGNMTVTGKTVTPNIDSSGNLTFTGISGVNVDSNGDMTFVE